MTPKVLRAVPAVLGLLIAAVHAHAEDKQLNVYNWANYISVNTVGEFEKATGIKVTYDTFSSDYELESKVMVGGTGYDVVTTAEIYFGRQIKAGVYQKLDKSKLPNWGNLDPKILAVEAPFDPGNEHAVPYLVGTNGFAYNVDMIKARMPNAPVDSLDMIFKPEIVSKFADCGVTLLDSPEDVLQLALSYLHLDPNSASPDDYKQVEKLLLSIRPYIRDFDSEQYMSALPNKERCIAMSWSGDYEAAMTVAKKNGIAINLAFTVPKEGANEWYDAWLIPAGAPHPDAAHKWINFILDPKVIAEITNEIRYANDNLASRPFVDPDLLNDPAIYPTPEIEKRLYRTAAASPALERLRSRTWTKIKTGL